MFFVYKRAATRELFAVHIEQARNVLVPGDTAGTDYKLASTSPGFLEYRDNSGTGISDGGIRWWMVFFGVPPSEWPSGV